MINPPPPEISYKWDTRIAKWTTIEMEWSVGEKPDICWIAEGLNTPDKIRLQAAELMAAADMIELWQKEIDDARQ